MWLCVFDFNVQFIFIIIIFVIITIVVVVGDFTRGYCIAGRTFTTSITLKDKCLDGECLDNEEAAKDDGNNVHTAAQEDECLENDDKACAAARDMAKRSENDGNDACAAA